MLVELGYDRTAYQDRADAVRTVPDTSIRRTLATQLRQGAVQGVNDALAGLGLPPPSNLVFP